MIEKLLRKAQFLRHPERDVLAGLLVDFVAHLTRRGHADRVIRAYVRAAAHFGFWLHRAGRTTAGVNRATVKQFLTRHLPHCRCPAPCPRALIGVRAALHQLLAIARPIPEITAPATPVDEVVAAFEGHLKDTCGLAPATRIYYTRYVRDLLHARYGRGAVQLDALTLGDISSAFVAARASHLVPASAHTVVTGIRSFLRYLQLRGLPTAKWADTVPRAACWRLASLPEVLNDDQVRALLATFDHSTASGRRGYAIAACFTHLALRAGEVARIALDDVDWRANVLTVAAGKGRHADRLPMPAHVASALVEYLRYGRPPTDARAIFVHHRAPVGRPLGASGVRGAMRQAYARAGFEPRVTGTHVLRHTAATRMLRDGSSMKEIADVLRHRSLDASAIYAKVDRAALAGVALPKPAAMARN